MTHSTDTTFLNIENDAHGGAFGKNPIPEPTEAQCRAGNYKMGRVSYHGLSIAIEQPRGTYRTGIDSKTGKRWTSRMAAHYGYISGTKGADGDGVDCFVGPYPQSEIAYAINQYIDGRFDEHKIMLAFPDEETARNAYLHSYDRGWKGLKSMIPLSINQLKWWLKHGNKSQPIKSENLPSEGLEAMTRKVHWDENAQPYNATLDQVLYEIRQSDSGENLLLDAVSIDEIIADSDGILALDALVTPYIKLQRRMDVLQVVMERMGTVIKPVAMQITEPFKQFGVANVAVVYELSDGQTVSIYFHNPDATPNKLAPGDDLISYKWLLNKKDITIVVAPERGQDLNIREVARRILKLAEKNSPAFARANAKRSDRMQNIQSLKDEIVVLEGELKTAQNELEIAKFSAEDKGNAKSGTKEEYSDQIKAAALWKGATMKVASMLEGDKRASLELSRMTTKGDLDTYLMRKFGIDETAARDISNILTAQDIPADMTANLDDYKDEPWYSLIPATKPILPGTEIAGRSLETYYDKNGLPFKTKTAAEDFRIENKLDVTHTVGPVTKVINNKYVEGYVVRPREIKSENLDPTSPEDYAKIMADSELQLKYQDDLDSLFQERIVAVRNALRDLGWNATTEESEVKDTYVPLIKNGVALSTEIDRVGAGDNVIGYSMNGIADDLTKTPEQIASEIDSAVPIPSNSTELNHSASEIEAESEDMKAAREFLKSVVDGDKDKDDLIALLDKIEASANAIIEAGKGEEFDALIGQAAEKWALLDQQTNG